MPQYVDGAAPEPASMPAAGTFTPSGAPSYGDTQHGDPPYGMGADNQLPPGVAADVHQMQQQLHYAAVVRANYEKQLQQLATALQSERVSKGKPAPVPLRCTVGQARTHFLLGSALCR